METPFFRVSVEPDDLFKSYYVVWKQFKNLDASVARMCLNRTM